MNNEYKQYFIYGNENTHHLSFFDIAHFDVDLGDGEITIEFDDLSFCGVTYVWFDGGELTTL